MTAAQTTPLQPAKRRVSRKQRRLAIIAAAGTVLALAAGLVLFAMRDTIVFFYGPTEIAEKGVAPGTRMRLGGLVEAGSVQRGPGHRVAFAVTDGKTAVKVSYDGLLPDLFREGQGVVTEGVFEGAGRFRADSVLAKHDETYMPREVADTLKKQGHWQGETGAAAPARP
ncbi:MAG: cytochrome c maturation protein CcmE [Bosea sp. (in: a-proteobacteria)]|uniref:cytochrome c maturation protein CcmE n=1 Tax=unclassified Bosea (in: a-proteobacteria) TaxID=2653178 RepID=UPI0009591C94|nr:MULTISPECIES: cytochrome c maturation protein CcmE [unclassified Bosea (in: a-proteobacteria)]MBN9444258.1 cytochrome c maturation protein CcmE [Bosea sp. (in: a-proteobacteria)]MBN9456672.1 cytochrome c maturation protein CcmE [Bosea sp. (in: a-proteobacteria)]OJV08900.1 MAG: cytochrome c biogenesis protein CcmE [Bosea sp. 67-29]